MDTQTTPERDPSRLLGDAGHTGEDARLIRRAIRNRWPIPDKLRAMVVAAMGEIVGSSPEERNRIAAAKVLTAAEAQNMADDHLADKNARLDSGQATDRTEVVTVQLEFDNNG